jgi:tellurite resistance protein
MFWVVVLGLAIWLCYKLLASRAGPQLPQAPRELISEGALPAVRTTEPARMELSLVPQPRRAAPTDAPRIVAGPGPRWLGASEVVRVEEFRIAGGLVYYGSPSRSVQALDEPSLINPKLTTRRMPPSFDTGMSYWPSYRDISPENRGAYLSWLASGRCDPSAYIGYVFLYFYGLERRALLDGSDVQAIRGEVSRLLSIYAANRSFHGYANDFLTFTLLTGKIGANDAQEHLSRHFGQREMPTAMLLADLQIHERPLNGALAARLAPSLEEAKGGVVVTRSAAELNRLFLQRYREKHGDGLVLAAAARPLVLTYRAASAAISHGHRLESSVPNVLGKPSQFKSIVSIWNSCVEDLRGFSTAQRKATSPDRLSTEMWEAMPAELRLQVDHPDKESWEQLLAAAPKCARGHVLTAKQMSDLVKIADKDRYTSAQLRKGASSAASCGFAIEPDPRASSSGALATSKFVLWKSNQPSASDTKLYGAAATVLKLAVHVANADGQVTDDERQAMTDVVESLFTLDEDLRARLECLRDLLVLDPPKATTIARKLAEASTKPQREKIGRLLVTIAAADGELHAAEHKALKSLYKALGLAPASLDGAIATCGVRLSSDGLVPMADVPSNRPGSAVTKPLETSAPRVRLNQAAIEAILADTREVSALLASVLDTEDDDGQFPEPVRSPATATSTASNTSAERNEVGEGLEPAYRAALAELLTKRQWNAAEVRELATRCRVMPSAMLETINTWSDETLGDYVIVGEQEWTIRTDLLRSTIQ